MFKKQLRKIKFLRELSRFIYRSGIKGKIRQPFIKILLESQLLQELNCHDLVRKSQHYYQYGPVEHISVSNAYYLQDMPSHLQEELQAQEYTIPSPYIFELNNIYLVGKYAIGLTPQGEFIRETSFPYYIDNIAFHTADSLSLRVLTSYYVSPASQELPIACSLINSWNNNYFHWIVDTLTKLEGVRYYENKTGLKVPLIIPTYPTKWQIESLRYLGYKQEDLILWNSQKTLVRKLIVPSFRKQYKTEGIYNGYDSPQACLWVAQKIKQYVWENCNSSNDVHPYIYISRHKAVGRQILNEAELNTCLQKYNFRRYTLEDLTLADQINLFSQAKFIIAPHGAGLTNMIFSTNAKVIEICGVTPPNLVFANLGKSLGFQYGCLTNPDNFQFRKEDGNIQVDLERLTSMMNMFI